MGSICNLGAICAEVATVVAGGATLLPGGSGWWVNGNGQVEREGVALLIVGAAEIEGVIEAVLKGSGEKAVFYIAGGGGSQTGVAVIFGRAVGSRRLPIFCEFRRIIKGRDAKKL